MSWKTCFSCFSCFLLFSYLKNERKIFRIFELFAQISRLLTAPVFMISPKTAAAKAAAGAASAAVSRRAAQRTELASIGEEGRVLQSVDAERSLNASSTSTHPRVFQSSEEVASNSVLQPSESDSSEVFPEVRQQAVLPTSPSEVHPAAQVVQPEQFQVS